MGDASLSDRCSRYCKEFNDLAVAKFSPQSDALKAVIGELELGFDDGSFEVKLGGVLKGDLGDGEFELRSFSFEGVAFNIDIPDDDLLADTILAYEIHEIEAIMRLERAGLIARRAGLSR